MGRMVGGIRPELEGGVICWKRAAATIWAGKPYER
jgi:hypothetical protein